ncbi:RagB/SusD family nutrient uptake outer membrane protein [Pedobacter alpinus]|uniref:RagB/SusD family nutrient uptake outer membrane protein n=1 Tax=Pedobacter alpinus TaxID=1590643 RepID=A0ABW5TP67_9SPHI
MKTFLKLKFGHFVLGTLVVALTLGACQRNFLDLRTQGEYNIDNYPFPGGAGPYDQFINGAYSDLRNFDVTVQAFVGITNIRSDDADKGSTPSDGATLQEMDAFTMTPANGLINGFWLGHFRLISSANFILDRIKNDPNPNTAPSLKIDAEAQAKFFRAYAYFMMVRSFGAVPIIDSVTTGTVGSTNVPRSAPSLVYAFIENDLRFAAANLLQKSAYDRRFIGRITAGAANGLLAKVYLTQGKWAQAQAAADLVMKSGEYDLSVSYRDIFEEAGENSRESILEVQATADAANPTIFGSQYSQVQGVRGAGDWNLGWGFNVPSTALDAAYEPNDPRKARTILYSGGTSLYGEAVPAGLPNPRYNNKVSSPRSRQTQVNSRSAFWNNVRLLRYADVVLMYAEASNEIGGTQNTTDALAALNSIRARARRGAVAGTLPDVTTRDQTLLRDAIHFERRIEFAMEHERFFDLVRWGTVAVVMQNHGKAFVPNKHELLPVPQVQRDLSRGVLTQNPGY